MTVANTVVFVGENQLNVTCIRDLDGNLEDCVTTDRFPSGGVARFVCITTSDTVSEEDIENFRRLKTLMLAIYDKGDSLLNHFSTCKGAAHPLLSAVERNHLEYLFQDEGSSNWLKSLQEMHFFCTADSWEETKANMPSVYVRMVELVKGSSQ